MKLRCALAAASALSGLAMVLNATDAQADGMNQPPPPPQWGFQWESGVRYWYSTGNHQFNLGGITSLNPLVSRLTWTDLTAHSAETFLRLDHRGTGLFVKGSLGAGSIVGGNLQDEDFPPGVAPYSSTNSQQRDGDMRYYNVDVGWSFWRTPDHRIGAFVGYGVWDERVRAFGCQQTATNPGICVPPIPSSALGISQSYDWEYWRLGLVGDARLGHGFSVSGEVAWLPGATLSGSDTHHWRPSSLLSGFDGPTPFDARSNGVQLEAVLKYAVTSQFDVGVGGRYWHVTDGDGRMQFGVSIPGALPQASSSSSERAGVFVQGSYKLN